MEFALPAGQEKKPLPAGAPEALTERALQGY